MRGKQTKYSNVNSVGFDRTLSNNNRHSWLKFHVFRLEMIKDYDGSVGKRIRPPTHRIGSGTALIYRTQGARNSALSRYDFSCFSSLRQPALPFISILVIKSIRISNYEIDFVHPVPPFLLSFRFFLVLFFFLTKTKERKKRQKPKKISQMWIAIIVFSRIR